MNVYLRRIFIADGNCCRCKQWLNKSTKGLLSAASVFVSGSDLFVWTNYSGIDVVGNSNSASLGGTGGVGQDMMAIAAPRGLSFGIKVTF